MFKKLLIPVFILSVLLTSCGKEEDLIQPSFSGTYEFQKVELVVDGNSIVVPTELATKDLIFNSDGTFTTPDDLIFFEGKYKYDSDAKTITFTEDSDPKNVSTSILNVTTGSGLTKLTTKKVQFSEDLDFDTAPMEDLLIFFSFFSFDEKDAAYLAFEKKVGDNPKDFSLVYTLKKK